MMQRAMTGLLALVITVSPALAEAVKTSLRPVARGDVIDLVMAEADIVSRAAIVSTAEAVLGTSGAMTRPVLRPAHIAAEAMLSARINGTQAGFEKWLQEFRPRAMEQGISAATFDRAFKGVTFDRKVVERDRNQSEFTKTLWDYLDSAASDARIRNGKAALNKNRSLLEKIEAEYGVQKEIVVAIWGLESAYGTFRGSTPVIEAMASLAYDARRAEFFEGELIHALTILQDGHTNEANLRGSWAGAMGHTQFMPGSFQRLAVDYNGDGKRDIWGDDPTDALASTANYLKSNGWKTGVPWGVEVTIPRNFDYMDAKREITRLPSAWARKGVLGLDGKPVQDFGPASVLLPAGHSGAAFLIFDNFEVIETYNTADAYVIGVGHLADRIKGDGPIKGTWPRTDRALTFKERIELQKRLTAVGFSTQGIDAKIGPLTVEAVRQYQKSQGLVPDGYASLAVLNRLR
ncbi:lytic murein transglycosylase [Antarctobacter jejuensis]|uniref:lytic murein transglycosylase n=1 Tax=Antarctobacter jejuensis TaxID=1439938 RepID=UPI003FD0554F